MHLTKEQCEQELKKLSDHFGVTAKLRWHGGILTAFARYRTKTVHLGPKCSGLYQLTHEYAHILTDARHGAKLIRDKRKMHHGSEFQDTLWEVIGVTYSDPSKYPWYREYHRVKAYGNKKLKKLESRTKKPNLTSITNSAMAQKGNNMFTIEEGIAIPKAVRKGKTAKYNFAELKVNTSFFVANAEGKTSEDTARTLTHAAYAAKPKVEEASGKFKFIVRPFTQPDGTQGARIWRVAAEQE